MRISTKKIAKTIMPAIHAKPKRNAIIDIPKVHFFFGDNSKAMEEIKEEKKKIKDAFEKAK
jgi:hypothetical protein